MGGGALMDFDDFLKRVVSDSVNATQTPIVMCRTCDAVGFCQPFTLHTDQDLDRDVTTGQCDECLESVGPDDYCVIPEEDNRTGVDD